MMREWRRLYRLRGYTPFGALLAVLLAVLVAADRMTDHWAAAAQQRDALEQQVAAMRATLERSRKIDTALESARARLAAVAGRIVTAADANAASELLAQATQKWLVSMGATGAAASGTDKEVKATKASSGGADVASGVASGVTSDVTSDVKSGVKSGVGVASGVPSGPASGTAAAEITVRVMPQQLLRMLGQWQQAPLAMRLVRLEVTVDNPNAPTALDAMLRVEGIYQRPQPAASDRPNASGARPAKAQETR